MNVNKFDDVKDLKDKVEITIKDKTYPGFIIQARIDLNSVPKEYYVYDLREWDEEPEDAPCACEIKNSKILVNFMGTFFSKTQLPLEKDESYTYDDGLDISFI